MTFYKIIPTTVEAHRFDGSRDNVDFLMAWLIANGVKNAVSYPGHSPWTNSDGKTGHPGWPAQFDLKLNRVKIANVGDYIVRHFSESDENGVLKSQFKVYTEKYFRKTYDHACPTCSGRVRETVDLVCQTCGHNYAKGF